MQYIEYQFVIRALYDSMAWSGKKEQFSCTLSELHLPDHLSDEEQERRGEEEIKRAHPRRTRNKQNLNQLGRDLSLKKAEMPLF